MKSNLFCEFRLCVSLRTQLCVTWRRDAMRELSAALFQSTRTPSAGALFSAFISLDDFTWGGRWLHAVAADWPLNNARVESRLLFCWTYNIALAPLRSSAVSKCAAKSSKKSGRPSPTAIKVNVEAPLWSLCPLCACLPAPTLQAYNKKVVAAMKIVAKLAPKIKRPPFDVEIFCKRYIYGVLANKTTHLQTIFTTLYWILFRNQYITTTHAVNFWYQLEIRIV